MLTIRRVYLFVVAAVGLGMLVVGLWSLGDTLINVAFETTIFGAATRDSIATSTAVAMVGLVGWLLHWRVASQQSDRSLGERASPLRRLYLYATAAALLFEAAAFARGIVEWLLTLPLGRSLGNGAVLSQLWGLALFGALWFYHWQILEKDRAAVGEVGSSATLRRWYSYGVQFVSYLGALLAARYALQTVFGGLQTISTSNLEPAASALTWIGVWLWHARWSRQHDIFTADAGSTLRPVYRFLVVSVSVALVLVQTSRFLYVFLAKALAGWMHRAASIT